MGVFATRSPFRPNPLGLSSVQLEAIEHRPDVGPVLIVRGADLMDGTPIYDIKPYIPYADCHPDAAAGFTAQTQFHHLTMVCNAGLCEDSLIVYNTLCITGRRNTVYQSVVIPGICELNLSFHLIECAVRQEILT